MSDFSFCIKQLLDETKLFNRDSWSHVLDIPVSTIDDWTTDKDIPRPYALGMLLEVLNRSTNIPQNIIKQFEAMAEKRATKISPFGSRMLPTVKEYYSRPIFSELSSKLAKLDDNSQGELLLILYPEK